MNDTQDITTLTIRMVVLLVMAGIFYIKIIIIQLYHMEVNYEYF